MLLYYSLLITHSSLNVKRSLWFLACFHFNWLPAHIVMIRSQLNGGERETFQQIQCESLVSSWMKLTSNFVCVCDVLCVCSRVKCDLTSNSTSNYRSATDEVNLCHKLATLTSKFMMTKTPFKRISIVLFLAFSASAIFAKIRAHTHTEHTTPKITFKHFLPQNSCR